MWQNSRNKWEKKITIVLFIWYVWVFFFVLVGSWCSNSSISNFLNISIWMCMWLFHVVTIGTFKIYLFWWFWEECLNLMLIVHLSYLLIRHTFDIQSWSDKLMFLLFTFFCVYPENAIKRVFTAKKTEFLQKPGLWVLIL